MIKHTILAGLSSLMMVATAQAAPMLKADVVVSAAVVTVGDMFDNAGLAAEDALFRAPQPGTTGTVTLADVRAAAARIGIEAFGTQGVDAVRVTRSAAIVDEVRLTQLIVADLTKRGIIANDMSADTLFATPIVAMKAEMVDQPATLVNLRYLPGNGAFSARFLIAGIDKPLDVSGTIELSISAPHLVGSLPAGTVLSAADIVMRPVPLRFAESTGIAQFDQIVGMALTRQSRDGMMIKPNDVSTPLAVAKNDVLTIYFRKGLMTLTVKGQAITGGALGSPIQVLNLVSKRVISATVVSPGAVAVNAEPLSLAGL